MVKTYDPKKVLISLGTHAVTGYSDGSFVNIEPHGEGTTKKVGSDGEVVASVDPDDTATVTLTLLQTSPTVAFAQRIYGRFKETGETFPVLVKDLKGGLLFAANDAWIVNTPSREFGKGDTDREIEIATGAATWEGES